MSTLLKFLVLATIALTAKALDENRPEAKRQMPRGLRAIKTSPLLPHCWN